ncbi:efflux RND transporter periplasmic adaptor subunit [Lysobacter pythonis]|uniref:Efflux RND transporter periplasmic adaptor subunit n=1 Tax=Solilutibacter pythonis TaxID=2483112 RepID=A0A3M2HRZ2_9GAMM|nr:efflux RND transporter periplasmic adaptor subunit [Lysobacter pythonis]RMH91025.1 efflux RND transporter periplasmic adaptor subunit [Lysobacter pythonis]
MLRGIRTPAVACLTIALLAGCGGKTEAEQGRRSERPLPVGMDTVREQPWRDTVRALGTVKARESVEVTAKVSETVRGVHFESGQQVARGAALVTLSGQQQLASLRAAEAAAAEAEQLYQRQSQLAAQQLVARASLDSQRATRDAARAQVAQIRANLADRVIRAPFSGVLGIRQVSPGALVTPGTVIATLDDLSHVHVDFPLPESALAGAGKGQVVVATSVAWPGREFAGHVSTIATRLDEASRAAIVRADFANAERALKPGMLMEVRLVRGEVSAIVVPEIAVQQVGSETFVWRVGPDGGVEKAAIEVGGRVPGRVRVAKGLTAGERIVTEGVGKLRAGARVVQAGGGAKPARATGG